MASFAIAPVSELGNRLDNERPLTTRLRWAPPQSLEHHNQAIAKVPDLSPKQRNALRNVMMGMTRDVSFARMVPDQANAKGPWSDQAMGEGRPL